MPGRKNPMCNTFPRYKIQHLAITSNIQYDFISGLLHVIIGGGALGVNRRISMQYAFLVSII